jgi:cytochrome c-type protein NapC
MKKSTLGALVAGAVIGLGISYFAAVMVDITGQPNFCANCHEMKPMKESFEFSVHGGNNPHGFAAHHCTDCHVSHAGVMSYLITKGLSATKDALAKAGLIKMVDFKENFWEMKEYVYDNACLHCHKGVEELKEKDHIVGMDEDLQEVHKKFYWEAKEKGEEVSCTKCHNDYVMPNFAHPNLLETLESQE